jgi:hypothetical protein
MHQPKAFISFDFDDLDVKEGLVAQAKMENAPFAFIDNSIKAPIDGVWVAEARRKIRESDWVIVICGQQSHQAKGQETELQIAKEESKQYFLLREERKAAPTRPKSARPDEPIYPARWSTIAALLRGEHPDQ